jgi:hypothetical protein
LLMILVKDSEELFSKVKTKATVSLMCLNFCWNTSSTNLPLHQYWMY